MANFHSGDGATCGCARARASEQDALALLVCAGATDPGQLRRVGDLNALILTAPRPLASPSPLLSALRQFADCPRWHNYQVAFLSGRRRPVADPTDLGRLRGAVRAGALHLVQTETFASSARRLGRLLGWSAPATLRLLANESTMQPRPCPRSCDRASAFCATCGDSNPLALRVDDVPRALQQRWLAQHRLDTSLRELAV